MAYQTAWWQNRISPEARRRMRLTIAVANRNMPGRKPDWGNLRRSAPFSNCYGWDRGQPVDRVYIERFLHDRAALIRGDVLEVKDSGYTRRYGARDVCAHVLDNDSTNQAATVRGDVCNPATVGADSYDCIILTQTLQYLSDPSAAISNLYAALRANGTLLISVPSSARLDQHAPESDFWRWTPAGLATLLDSECPGAAIDVEGGGNLTASLAVMLGCAQEDLAPNDLDANDPIFPVVACAAVTKPPGRQ